MPESNHSDKHASGSIPTSSTDNAQLCFTYRNPVRYPLPTFLTQNVELSLTLLQCHFEHSATELHKASALLEMLPGDLLLSLPNAQRILTVSTSPYSELVALLRRAVTPTDAIRFQEFLQQELHGDQMPSAFLARLLLILGHHAPTYTDLIRTVFISRMPENIRLILISQGSTLALQDLAVKADELMVSTNPHVSTSAFPIFYPSNTPASHAATTSSTPASPYVNSISSPVSTPSLSQTLRDVQQQLASLTLRVDNLNNTRVFQAHSPPRSQYFHPNNGSQAFRPRSSSPRPRLPDPPADCTLCFYHYHFGFQARRCKGSCSFHSKNLADGATKPAPE